jgi:cyclase
MHKVRVIPVLLLKHWGIEKSIQFGNNVYVGSPINAVRVFNGRNVDELILLDIVATPERRGPNLEVIRQITSEAQMPLTVGGGIRSLDTIRGLMASGVDRVAINTAAAESPGFVREAADIFGSQCIVVSLDVLRRKDGRCEVHTHGGTRATGLDPVQHARNMERHGAGELLLTSINRDGGMAGYDIELIRAVADAVSIPVIACGGAGSVAHLGQAVSEGHASAVAAGAYFLFFGPRRTVLITYPEDAELINALGSGRVRLKDAQRRPPERPARS